mmetsp:Transcript_30567/g.97575  ORF Transcript_30567/g.97575 Transcript_30567/m.97575 type:complete len:210 (-) Transcript_30567:66-695(-)
MPPLDDALEKLTARTELHHQMYAVLILVCPLQSHDVGVTRQVVHDSHLPAHILYIVLAGQLPLGNGLAGVLIPGRAMSRKLRNPELAAAEHAPQCVVLGQVLGFPPEYGRHAFVLLRCDLRGRLRLLRGCGSGWPIPSSRRRGWLAWGRVSLLGLPRFLLDCGLLWRDLLVLRCLLAFSAALPAEAVAHRADPYGRLCRCAVKPANLPP